MLEKNVEKALVGAVTARGGLTYKFLSPERGVPDRIVILGGRVCFVELKNGSRGRLSKLQEWQHGRLRKAGAQVFVVRTETDVQNFVESVQKEGGEIQNEISTV